MHVDRARSRRRDTRQVEKLIASGCVEPQRARQRVYPASKAALNMVTAMYAKALPQVRVVAVDPGYTATALNGFTGPQSVGEGTDAIVTACTGDTLAGPFFDRNGALPW